MNQILYNCNCNEKIYAKNSTVREGENSAGNISVKSNKWYKLVFYASLFLLIFFIFLFFVRLNENSRNEKISKKLTSSYSITTMYSNSSTNSYSTVDSQSTPFVIRDNKNR